MQAPKYAQPGQKPMEMTVILELKVIADVGLVGFPTWVSPHFYPEFPMQDPR